MPTRLLRDWTDSFPLAELSPEAERFFVRLIMKADDFGRFHGDERLLKSALFPLLTDVRLSAVRSWRDECQTAGLIARYQDERGRDFIEIANFNQQRRSKSKFPEPADNAQTNDNSCAQPENNCALYSEAKTETLFEDGDVTSPDPDKPDSERKPRQRNENFDALAKATGSDPTQMTKTAARACGVALAEIRAACPSLDPSEILRRAANYASQFGDASITPSALAKHWALCDNGKRQTNGKANRTVDRNAGTANEGRSENYGKHITKA